MTAGMEYSRAFSRADIDVRREAEAVLPTVKQVASGESDLVALFAREQLADVQRLTRSFSGTDRRYAFGRLRHWGVLRMTIKEAEARHRARAARRPPPDLASEQRQIIRDEVPAWQWPVSDHLAPGLRGCVETNRTGAVHIWTIVAFRPLRGAGSRFLDSLPHDARIRVFGVAAGSLMEAMLLRRGFSRSRYRWAGLRRGTHAAVPAWSWMYR